MNYKRHKPKTQVRCSYCTDNRIGNSGRTKNLEDDWRPVPSKKPSWYCKKLKGKHKFVFKREEDLSFFPETFLYFECIDCGRKKIKAIDRKTSRNILEPANL